MKIAVGGAIGSGKSTFCKWLENRKKIKLINEFEEDDSFFKLILKEMYSGEKYAVGALQYYFLEHGFNVGHVKEDVIVDRDILEHNIFASNSMNAESIAYKAYSAAFEVYWNQHIRPDVYIILDCEWEVAKERILKRGRSEEINNFKKNEYYFLKLHTTYFSKLTKMCIDRKIDIIIINSDEDKFYENPENIRKIDKITTI